MEMQQDIARKNHILVVDDDDRIRTLLFRYLTQNDFLVTTAHDSAQARDMMRAACFDAIVLDVMMPGETGIELTQDISPKSDIPILLLTALGETDDRITGLEAGADDYLPKPFEPKELLLRLNAILKRKPKRKAVVGAIKIGRWLFDPDFDELKDGDEAIRLTSVEAGLLKTLANNAGQVVSRDMLAESGGEQAGERTIDVQVTRLRKKIEDNPKSPRYLQTVRGQGYLLRIEE